MIRFMIRIAVFLASSALGLAAASLILTDFRIQAAGFITAVIVFTVAQGILAPFIFKMTRQYASALIGGVGLLSTYVALLIASLFSGGLQITGVSTWILATLIVWLVTALGTWLLPLAVLKNQAGSSTS